MNKIELIDRAELMEKLRIVFPCSSCWEKKEPCIGLCYSVKMAVILTPTIDAAPVRRGEWVQHRSADWNGMWMDYELGDKCTSCGFEHYGSSIKHYNYCPNCGADMRGVSE